MARAQTRQAGWTVVESSSQAKSSRASGCRSWSGSIQPSPAEQGEHRLADEPMIGRGEVATVPQLDRDRPIGALAVGLHGGLDPFGDLRGGACKDVGRGDVIGELADDLSLDPSRLACDGRGAIPPGRGTNGRSKSCGS